MNIFANIFSIFYIGYTIVYIIGYVKGNVKLTRYPIFPLLGGIIIIFTVSTLLNTLFHLSDSLLTGNILLAVSFFIGGFVATFESRDNKIQFAIYVGIIFLIFSLILGYNDYINSHSNIRTLEYFIISITIISLLFATIGGFIAYKCKEFIIKKQGK